MRAWCAVCTASASTPCPCVVPCLGSLSRCIAPPHTAPARGDDVKTLVAVFAPVQTSQLARAGHGWDGVAGGGGRLDPTAHLIIVTADSTGTVQVFENFRGAAAPK